MNKELGFRIHQLRDATGFTQSTLAERLGMSRQRLARIEDGKINITYADICGIADVLGVNASSITEVINNKQSPRPFFRNDSDSVSVDTIVEQVDEILRTFYTHKKLRESSFKSGE